MNIIGDVKGRFCILIDDIVDSAGTLCNAAAALMEAAGHRGSRRPMSYAWRAFRAARSQRVEGSELTELVITDSIVATDAIKATKNIRQIPIAPLLAEAMRRINEERSVSSLFD